jgi:predicted nucleotide-binding protein (sugar kinase/HSP70/actin superfamily)
MKVGIPRGLLYYHYYPMWKVFLEEIGVEVITSPPTSKEILDLGTTNSQDDVCLPVKIFFGHTVYLAGKKVDFLFIPRIVAVEKEAYTCPKFLGLPDVIRSNLSDIPPILDATVNVKKRDKSPLRAALEIGKKFGVPLNKIRSAYESSCHALWEYRRLMLKGHTPDEAIDSLFSGKKVEKRESGDIKIGVVGHPYNVYDRFSTLDMLGKLKNMGAQVITGEMIRQEDIEHHAEFLPKRLFWSYERDIVGSAFYLIHTEKVDGIINVVSFECGPDSLITELIQSEARRQGNFPIMVITLDEHTGEAGLLTRLEAFIDMLRMRKR